MKKVIRDGKVAVLYSPGFGAGWSTWNDTEKDYLLFDEDIVLAVERGDKKLAAEIAERKGKELFGQDDYTCIHGARDLEIEWIPQGQAFEILEYDGSETIKLASEIDYKTA